MSYHLSSFFGNSETLELTIAIAELLFALVHCFFGYKLRKILIGIGGFSLGFLGSAFIMIYTTDQLWLILVVVIACSLVLGILAFRIYRFGIFAWTAYGVFLAVSPLIQIEGVLWASAVIGAIVGIFVGILTLKFLRPAIILGSSFSGGFSAVQAGNILIGNQLSLFPVSLIALGLGAAGTIFQFLTTRSDR